MNTTRTITTKHFPALTYRRTGNGPAIMLLHGFPASGVLWNNVVPELSNQYTLLIPDLPGAGVSRLEGETVSIEELAAVVPAILDDADFRICVLAGHSMGGYVAIAAAELCPERLSGLLFVHSTALEDDAAKREKRQKSIALIRKGGREEFIKGMIPALFSESFRNSHPETVKTMLEEGLKLPAESAIAFYGAMMRRPDRSALLNELSCPAGWIMGRDDTTIPWQSNMQQTVAPRVSFVTLYDDCGHMSMIEQPAALSAHLLAFTDYCTQHAEAIGE